MRKWKYYRMHIPLACACLDQVKRSWSDETDEEMTEVEFLRTLSRWNYLGQGHWQYWS